MIRSASAITTTKSDSSRNNAIPISEGVIQMSCSKVCTDHHRTPDTAPQHGIWRSRAVAAGVAVVVLSVPQLSLAVLCSPPSTSHPTLQQAVDDPACTIIELAAQAYPEQIEIRRSLTLTGTGPLSSTVDGPILIRGPSTQVDMTSIGIRNGCPHPGLRVKSGALISPVNVRVSTAAIGCPPLPDLIFTDRFE